MNADGATSSLGPVLAVCGWSGSGKTTLLEAVIPALLRQGLAVAVVKHDAHGIDADRPGKDSDRLFRAGADVTLEGPGEALRRSHGDIELVSALRELLAGHDLVLVEGHKTTPVPKVWLASPTDPAPPPEAANVVAALPWGGDRTARLLAILDELLPRAWREVPLMGGVLIGGASRRMGRPKHLLEFDGRTFLERAVGALGSRVRGIAILGDGALPPELAATPQLADAPGLEGPLAGILTAMRWAPDRAWLVAACDLPRVTAAAVEWLIAQRGPGRWAVIPRLPSGLEPLLALYEPQARGVLEGIAARGLRAPRLVAEHPKAHVAAPPANLLGCWDNVNTAGDLAELGPDLSS